MIRCWSIKDAFPVLRMPLESIGMPWVVAECDRSVQNHSYRVISTETYSNLADCYILIWDYDGMLHCSVMKKMFILGVDIFPYFSAKVHPQSYPKLFATLF